MCPATTNTAYNERLFSRAGLRRFYHLARFRWAAMKVAGHLQEDLKVIELGCYDGRLLDSLGSQVKEYVGLDANWDGGLDLARQKFEGRRGIRLIETDSPVALDQFGEGAFDLAASLETLEHLPPGLVPSFLDQLERVTNGHLLVTVPNELGPIFLAKFIAKRIRYGGGERYTPREVIAAVIRRSDRIERFDHKGFDYRQVVAEISCRFDIVSVEGIPPVGLPAALSPTVGILARTRA